MTSMSKMANRTAIAMAVVLLGVAAACRGSNNVDPALQRDLSAATGHDSANDLELAPKAASQLQVVSAIEGGPAPTPHAPDRVRIQTPRPAHQSPAPNVRRPERVATATVPGVKTTAAASAPQATPAPKAKAKSDGEFVDPVVAPLPASSVSRGSGASLGAVLSRLPGRINP